MIIGISGKIGNGKDTVGKIIQIITSAPHFTNKAVEDFLKRDILSPFEIKKFADSLKDIVCILIGCTREQLEDANFKNKELGEEWWYYQRIRSKFGDNFNYDLLDYYTHKDIYGKETHQLIKLTPRKILQLLGTEAGRNIIHPNVWVNALFADYKPEGISQKYLADRNALVIKNNYPTWVITDLRFPNEFKAVKDRGGITIRVNRDIIVDFHGNYVDETYRNDTHKVGKQIEGTNKYIMLPLNEHPSETALDNVKFDYTIDNNGTIEELIEKVREILIKESIICYKGFKDK